ncbi:MAG: aldo/keto reductase [Xanthomonadales bacterium]|nr:aldo/keto reductase [Xanthomonadales bacterium]
MDDVVNLQRPEDESGAMKRRRLPQTDLVVSPIALGAMGFGGSWNDQPVGDRDLEAAASVLDAALEHGINHIDLADIYTLGKSDQVLGRIFAARSSLRDQFVVQQKCGIILPDDSGPKRYDLSHDHIVKAVELSLARLGTDRIDLLALHRPDPLVEPEEVARAFDQLHSAGKVRYFGVSNHSASQLLLLRRFVDQPLVVNQLQLSLTHHRMISAGIEVNTPVTDQGDSAGLLDFCRLHDMTVQAWSPLNCGRMFDPDYKPRLAAVIDRLAGEIGCAVEAIALAWLLRHPAGIQPIVGTLKPERLARCAEAAEIRLTRCQWYELLDGARGGDVP